MNKGWEQVLERFLTALDRVLAPYTAVLYGSTVRGGYHEGRSDINLMVLARELGAEQLRALRPGFELWREAGQSPPLLMTEAEWRRSADAFPIEITDMKLGYRTVRGTDPVAPLSVDPRDLRHALEREFRGKLMRLRQALVALGHDSDDLTALTRASTRNVLVLLRAGLIALGSTPPATASDTVREAIAAFRIPPEAAAALSTVFARRDDAAWRCSEAEFAGYLQAVESAAHFVDQL